MKNITIISSLIIFFFCTTTSIAQEFNALINDINANLNEVESGKYKYTQEAIVVQPGVVQFTIIKTALKDGKSIENLFEINLGDVDINTVKTITDKDVIQVQLLSSKKQDLFKHTEDQEKISYITELQIFAADIDNARALEKKIKQLIPISISITDKRLSLNTYDEHINWLSNNITDVNLIKTQFAQKMEVIDAYPGKLSLSITENAGKSSKSVRSEFNLMTINPNSVIFNIQGEVFSIEFETRRKLKTIKQFKDGIQENYTDDIKIICSSVAMAKDLQKVLKKSIELAQVAFDNKIPEFTSIDQSIENLNVLIRKVAVNETTINQILFGQCVNTFTSNTISSNKASTHEQLFNFKDLSKNSITYKTKGKFVIVSIATKGGADYIKNTLEDEQKNYTDKVDIYVPEVESAIITTSLLESIIDACTNKTEDFRNNSKPQLISLLENTLIKVDMNQTTYEQSITIEEDHNSVSLKLIEANEKSSEEKVMNFNLTDINPTSIKMETSGTNVIVTASTYYLEKIIKFYEDGEIENYLNEITLQANSIENARKITSLLKLICGNKK